MHHGNGQAVEILDVTQRTLSVLLEEVPEIYVYEFGNVIFFVI